jgi:hypothetical protein
MTRTIDQLYCTHCTYGTAAQHRHTGNVRNQAFEYSTRAGSVDLSLAHQTFQRFEKQFFRGVPMAGDASVELRRSTAEETPWRKLIYIPAVDGLRVLANVCYRPKDTAGRLGSYFAHVLLEKHEVGGTPWSPADCLKLWGASFWQTVDTDLSEIPPEMIDRSFVLEAKETLELPGYEGAVNDDALLRFLTSPMEKDVQAENASAVEIGLCVFPVRWRKKKSPEERTRLLMYLLRAVLELDIERQERLTIAVEPGVAALLFYGIARLLPGKLAQHLSFSTFESHFDKPTTVLAAFDFADPMVTDLLPETYRAKGFAINTYRPERSETKLEFRYHESCFAEMIVRTFIDRGPAAADRMLIQMAAVGPLSREVCESLTVIRNRVKHALDAETSSLNEFSRMTSVEKQFAGSVWVDLLATAPEETIRFISRKPIYIQVLEIVSSITNDPVAEKVIRNLVRFLPARDEVRNAFFGSKFVSPTLKTAWLRSFLIKNEQFPTNCPNLFETTSKTNPILTDLLQHATLQQASTWRELVPSEFAWQFTAALASAAGQDPQKRPLILAAIEAMDEKGLCKLFDKLSGRADLVLSQIKPNDVRFVQSLARLSEGIRFSSTEQIVARVEALLAASSHLYSQKGLLDRLAAARDAIHRCGHQLAVPKGQSTVELEAALGQALNSISFAFSDRECQLSPIETDLTLVEAMLRGWLRPDQSALCQQLVELIPKVQLSVMNDLDLCQFLTGAQGRDWLKKLPPADRTLSERLLKILDELPDNMLTFHDRLAGLYEAKSKLGNETIPGNEVFNKLNAWFRLHKQLIWIKELRQSFKRITDMRSADVSNASSGLASIIHSVLKDRIPFDSSKPAGRKLVDQTLIRNMSQGMIGDNTLTENMLFLLDIEEQFVKHSKGGFLSVFSKK